MKQFFSVLFLLVFISGLSFAQNSLAVDNGAQFTVNPKPHNVIPTNFTPIEEVFGLNQNAFGPSGLRGRGNIFLCTTPRKLVEHRLYLNPTAAANMWFVIYEGAALNGTYNLVHSINVPNQGPGEGWYSSGAIDFDFQAGMYYAIYPQWDVTANYWTENPVAPPYPIPASFGELVTGVGWDWAPIYGDPPPATQTVTVAATVPVAYYQTIVTDDIGGGGTITIAEAIEDLNMDFIPDRLGDTVTVEGVVFSPNYQTTHNSFYISDGTAGTDIFMYGPPQFNWAMGDMLQITGVVDQYNGMTEIIPADSSGWVFMSSGNPTPDPIVLTLAQYKANSEMYEGSLVGFVSLTLVGGTWPASGSTNLDFSDGIDTVVFRIDSDTDIPGQPEPTWPRDIIGIGSQFDSSTPPDGGYQIFPRFYATDFLPAGTIPVELTSFSASVNQNNVTLNWSTATETNNQGFDIQRSNGNEFLTIGFVSGNGTTTEVKTYSYTDRNLAAGSYSYRLKQVDFDGTFAYSDVVNADVTAPVQFELSQNYPNPFNPSTTINFSIPQSSIVTLKVFNTLGQEVNTLINQNMESGVHSISFDAGDLNSGIYFYKLDAGQFSEVRKMTLIK